MRRLRGHNYLPLPMRMQATEIVELASLVESERKGLVGVEDLGAELQRRADDAVWDVVVVGRGHDHTDSHGTQRRHEAEIVSDLTSKQRAVLAEIEV